MRRGSMSHWIAVAGFLAVGLGASRPSFADLDAYLARPEPKYKWEKTGESARDGVTITDLHMVSQEWQGHVWEHRIQIFRPNDLKYKRHCLIYNTGGLGGGSRDVQMGINLAKLSKTTYAIMYGNPKQPLYGGLTEDALIVYTWGQYMKTGDETWPLHFPMAKAVIKAMDTVQAWSKQAGITELDSFIVNGASKRGWTTWLVGASKDPRVKAIAPMVIDILNVVKQVAYQAESWGKLSEQIDDYSGAGLTEMSKTPQFAKLMKLEDPYSYLDRLTMPKLIILGTNDRYWTQDALNLYWDDLKGPKWVIYTPNSGHGLEDRERVFHTLASFTQMIASGKKWPQPHWVYSTDGNATTLTLTSDGNWRTGRMMTVSAPTKDFRDFSWTDKILSRAGKAMTTTVQHPKKGYQAIVGEFEYEIDGLNFTLSSQLQILGPQK